MGYYEVEIKETMVKRIIIEAESEAEAEEIASDMWHDEEIMLGSDDFDDVEFTAIKKV